MLDLFSQPDPMPTAYYNTTAERGADLKQYRAKAAAQDARVLDVLRSLGSASPSRVWIAMGRTCPITSVRRSLNTLTGAGRAVKTADKVTGELGRPEHVWTVIEQAA